MAKQTKADKILDLSKKKRLRYKLIDGQWRILRKKDTMVFTREELISFLVNNNIRAIRQLHRIRRPTIDPYEWAYRNMFGSWSNALRAAWGDTILFHRPCTKPRYIIDLMVEYNIKSFRQYEQLHKLHPDIVPSYRMIREHFGGMRFAQYVVRLHSIKAMVGEYIKLKKRLKKTPTWEECNANGIDPAKILLHFKKKSSFDDLVRELDNPIAALEAERAKHAKRRRIKNQGAAGV